MNSNNQPQKVICDNALSMISRIEIVENYSKKTDRYYPFMILHFKDKRKYRKSVFIDDLEMILIDNLLDKVDTTDNIFNDRERGL